MKVALHPTCTVDLLVPAVARAALRLLERLGLEVLLPRHLTCCGQPAFNAGHWPEAKAVAARFLDDVEHLLASGAQWVLLPSGSCAAMLRHDYPILCAQGPPELATRAQELARHVRELSSFLVHDLGVEDVGASFPAVATFHPSCHGSRLLGLGDEPLRLLHHVRGLHLVDLPYAEDCCGFGGTFAVKLPAVSSAMATEKVEHVLATGAELLVVNDTACGLQLAGRLRRMGFTLPVRHWVEVLAGEAGA